MEIFLQISIGIFPPKLGKGNKIRFKAKGECFGNLSLGFML